MAKSKSAKRRKAKQRQQQHRAEKRNDRDRTQPHDHLPKVGSPADDAYRLRRSREDLVDFGEIRRSKGQRPTILALGVGVLFALGILAWVLFV